MAHHHDCECGHDHHHEHEHESNSVQIDRYHEAFNKFEPWPCRIPRPLRL